MAVGLKGERKEGYDAISLRLAQETYDSSVAYLRAVGKDPEGRLRRAARMVIWARYHGKFAAQAEGRAGAVGEGGALDQALRELEELVGRPKNEQEI